MPEEEKALMEIAKNNTGKIEEHEHHDKPVTFGLSVTKSLGNNWNLETGLQYSLLKSDFTLGEGAYYINRNQRCIIWEYLCKCRINGLMSRTGQFILRLAVLCIYLYTVKPAKGILLEILRHI